MYRHNHTLSNLKIKELYCMLCGWTERVKATAHPCSISTFGDVDECGRFQSVNQRRTSDSGSFPVSSPLPTSRRLVHSLFGSRNQNCNSISNCQSLVFCLIKYVRSSHLRPSSFQFSDPVDTVPNKSWFTMFLLASSRETGFLLYLDPLNIFIKGFHLS
jgi:hypothetical protein